MNLHEALKVVKEQVETGTVGSYLAICAAVEKLELDSFVSAADQLRPLFKRWPKYSGFDLYPVPSPDKTRTNLEMFYDALAKDALWQGEYGALRKELLDFLIEETKP